jgi:hypothetical protein
VATYGDLSSPDALKDIERILVHLEQDEPFISWKRIRQEAEARGLTKGRDAGEMEAIWKEVVNANYQRAVATLRQCKIDREKLARWEEWLGSGQDHDDKGKGRMCEEEDDLWDLVEWKVRIGYLGIAKELTLTSHHTPSFV